MTTVIAMEVVAKRREDVIYSAFKDILVEAPVFYSTLAEIPPNRLFPGTVITIETPDCPECKQSSNNANMGLCPCGFNWEEWTTTRYKDVMLPGEETPPVAAENTG